MNFSEFAIRILTSEFVIHMITVLGIWLVLMIFTLAVCLQIYMLYSFGRYIWFGGKSILGWLNEPVSEAIFRNQPVRRWHFWHPGSGAFGGLVLCIILSVSALIVLCTLVS